MDLFTWLCVGQRRKEEGKFQSGGLKRPCWSLGPFRLAMHRVILLVRPDLGESRRPESRRIQSLDWCRPTSRMLLYIADTLKRRELFSKERFGAPTTTTTNHFWSHLHVEVAAADLRRRMEQFDIFELDPLSWWRVLHGHGAMICTMCGSELVKARMLRGRRMASDKFATDYISLRCSSRPCLPWLLNRSAACVCNTVVEQPCIQGVVWIQNVVLSYLRHMRQQRSTFQVL